MKRRRDKPFPNPPKPSPQAERSDPSSLRSPLTDQKSSNPANSSLDALLTRATTHHTAGRLAEAEALYREILATAPHHPDALHLLGVIALQVGHHQVAIELIDAALRQNPDYAEAHNNRGIALLNLHQLTAAVESYDRAIRLNPNFADAYSNRGNALNSLQQYQLALESCDRALALNPDFPEAHNNRGIALAGLKQHQAALEAYDRAIRLRPDYPDAWSNRGNSLQALNLGNPALARSQSSGRDLIFFCGRTHEIWNPDTIAASGAGGSEEAVLWLSRLLHRRGWNVTVYAHCGHEEKLYDGVLWRPYWLWNPHDRQDVTILWRNPEAADHDINSARIFVDLHDVVFPSDFPPERVAKIDTICVKSRFHRSLLPQVPDDKFLIAPNGIDSSLFTGETARDPHLLINTSSADRSLEAFLDCFEAIRREVPHARAQWAYGWAIWDKAQASFPERMQWKARIQQRMAELGVEDLGRLNHTEIAALYRRAAIFAYPTEMAEIDCISLSKAMAAGAIPITADFAALGEKSGHGGVFIHSAKTAANWTQTGQFHFEITSPAQKSEFIDAAVSLLRTPPSEADRQPMRQWAQRTFDWETIADAWHHALSSALKPNARPAHGPSLETLLERASTHHSAGRIAEAESLYRQVLDAHPDQPVALHLLGVIALQTGDYARALELIDRALVLNPAYLEALVSRGNALFLAHQFSSAVSAYDQALRLNPAHAEAHNNRASALNSLGDRSAALEGYNRAIQLNPAYTDAYANRANVLFALGRPAESLESAGRALALNPNLPETCLTRGNALHSLRQFQAAIQSYDRALELAPALVEAHNNRASSLHSLGRHDAAIAGYTQAIAINPAYADAYANRGNAFLTLGQYPAALADFDRALELRPGYPWLLGTRLHVKRLLCDWSDSFADLLALESAIARGEPASLPFTTLAVSSSPAVQRRAAEVYTLTDFPHSAASATTTAARPKIRIGYFSADFYNHATSYLMAGLIERHDRSRFEIFGFSFGPNSPDEMHRRVARAFDRFLDVRSTSDLDVAQLSRAHSIDIAVDLKGYTRDHRAGIFAHRAAPIQASYLGYPGTMGAPFIDYLIADPTLIPASDYPHYSEKIVTLPGSYQVNDSSRPIPAAPPPRATENLPPEAFVFCCFNNAYKITPAVFAGWMRILAAVPSSVLWLLEENPVASGNLRAHAARAGISPHRLIFAQPTPLPQHLARLALADLVLDTTPYGAHTTASDALWCGLPILTLSGETFASRVAASLLRAVNLPELITTTPAAYEALAISLAHDRARLATLRQSLVQKRLTAPLFDTPAFTRHLESAYAAMLDRHLANLPPDHITLTQHP